MSFYEKFKECKHPDATTRTLTVREVMEKDGLDWLDDDTVRNVARESMYQVFKLSEGFLGRQYYHRDMALEALERGDLDEVERQLNEIGVSGN